MAVYTKLLLSSGGGIISTKQQAEQVKNTASILIGLGGTGIDCLKTIKAAVRERLIPDDPEATVAEYRHIQFLGVDTDKKSFRAKTDRTDSTSSIRDLKMLDSSETFDISNPNIGEALSNVRAIQMRPELGWLRYEDIEIPDLTESGAGGFRQVGRFMMMDRSVDFMNQVGQLIHDAKAGLTNPDVNIHIFSGLGGGTGSGVFLDVCYMVKRVAAENGGATVYGYFFLPDVNLSNIPLKNKLTREFVPRNGYAAMQELDYCMRLGENGGAFVQSYKGNREIRWQEPPVTMCHLICATDTKNNVIPEAYNYAMNVTTEYLMDFLTEPKNPHEFGLKSHLANFRAMVAAGNGTKNVGAHLAYCILGASCASVPLRQINTYLAASLFARFADVKKNVPGEADVKRLANEAELGDYDNLLRELSDGAGDDFSGYPGTWKEVRDYGDGGSGLTNHYVNQTSDKLGRIESNAQSMMSEQNTRSLIARIRRKLVPYIRDLKCGPIFAYRLLEASRSHNLLNLIDGLLETNKVRWDQERAQDRYKEYESARKEFIRKPNKRRFEEFEWRIRVLQSHKRSISLYEQMERILIKLRKQIEDCTAGYYIILARVMENLIQTFEENQLALAAEKQVMKTDDFATPLMTIKELKPSLDALVKPLDTSGMLDQLIGMLLDHETDWITEDENKISRMVTSYFVDTAFASFANRTIAAFLADKYGTNDSELITNRLYNEYIRDLAQKAKPLFAFNTSIWDDGETGKLAFISVPTTAASVVAAAGKLCSEEPLYRVKESALTDRIYLMCSSCALPLGSYSKCAQYEQAYFSSEQAGRHYYEGKPDTMLFNDWRKLPSLTPESHINYETIPPLLRRNLNEAVDLYDRAVKAGLIQGNQICRLSDQAVSRLGEAAGAAARARENALKEPQNAKLVCTEAAKLLEKALDTVEAVPTDYELPQGFVGREETIERIRRDYFVSSPVFHILIRESMNAVDEARGCLEELQKFIRQLGEEEQYTEDFCRALFTGVIQFKTVQVTYTRSEYGIVSETVLSKLDDEFPYGSIPLYQALLTFKSMEAQERKAISAEARDRINVDDPRVAETVRALQDRLTDSYNGSMAQMAAKYPSEYQKIIVFLKELYTEFAGLKGLLGL